MNMSATSCVGRSSACRISSMVTRAADGIEAAPIEASVAVRLWAVTGRRLRSPAGAWTRASPRIRRQTQIYGHKLTNQCGRVHGLEHGSIGAGTDMDTDKVIYTDSDIGKYSIWMGIWTRSRSWIWAICKNYTYKYKTDRTV